MKIDGKRGPTSQRGFSLVAAIFVLVILAMLGAFMVTLSVIEHATASYAVQGARAYQAAISGLEWGIQRAVSARACPASPTTYNINVTGLSGFTVTVLCAATDHIEPQSDPGPAAFHVFVITSTATFGTFGAPDYFSRSAEATVTDATPP